jgi:hypothetical protein
MDTKLTYISTATTTVCRSVKGKLVGIIIEGGTAGTIIGYDNASSAAGNIVFSFDSTNALKDYNFFGANFVNGLVVVTGAATKLTVLTAPQGK